jgi:release factor glutamine methyltransferase
MTYREFLVLKSSEPRDGDTPFLDASLILAHCLGISREKLLMRFPEEAADIPPLFEESWIRRLAGESVAYIVGRKEFFGREFLVDGRVLVPRPDTETLVLAALEIGDTDYSAGTLRLHDVCTGSGAVAISLAAERPKWSVSASDISLDALEVARENTSRLLGKEILLVHADLLEGLEGPFDIITANPPYVPTDEAADLLSRGWKEPSLALDGGPEGLDIIASLIGQAGKALVSGGFLLIETDALQSRSVCDMFLKEGFCDCKVWKDLAGLDRITGARKP